MKNKIGKSKLNQHIGYWDHILNIIFKFIAKNGYIQKSFYINK